MIIFHYLLLTSGRDTKGSAKGTKGHAVGDVFEHRLGDKDRLRVISQLFKRLMMS